MNVGMRSAVLTKPQYTCNLRGRSRILGSAQRAGKRPVSAANEQFGEEAPGTGKYLSSLLVATSPFVLPCSFTYETLAWTSESGSHSMILPCG